MQTMATTPRSSPHRPAHSGFTLIELLAVITVIGVLAALIFTGVNSALQAARATESMSNLRAISQAFFAYANENEGKFPATGEFDFAGGGGWVGGFWPDRLVAGGYISVPDYRRGEDDQDGVFWDPAEENHHNISDYGPNQNIIPHSRPVPSVNMILNPATTMLICEARSWGPDGIRGSWWLKSDQWIQMAPGQPQGGSPLPSRHGDTVHMVFCDGHVQAVSVERVIEDRETLFTGPYDTTNPETSPPGS